MKKLLVLLITSLFFANYGFADANPVDTNSESIYINKNVKVVPITKHMKDVPLYADIHVTYPEVAGQDASMHVEKFNQLMVNMVVAEVEQFKKNVQQDLPHMQTLPESVRHNSLIIDYDIDIITPPKQTFISVRLNIEMMQAGRAHPLHTHRVLNFDLSNGKVLALSDLFNTNASYLKLLANYSNKKLNDTLQDKWMIAAGTKPNMKNYKNWNLEADGILVTFDEYQVAPYTYGPQEVEIPYAALKVLLSASAPIKPADEIEKKQLG